MATNFETLIDVDSLAQRLTHPDWAIFDCRFALSDTERGRRDFQKGHIPGARYVHLDEDLSGEIVAGKTGRHPLPTVAECEARFSAWGIDGDTQVVIYDDAGGAIAARMWWMLHWLGHNKAAVLDGGWPAWQQAGHLTRSQSPTREARRFIAQPQTHWTVDAKDVARFSQDAKMCVVDSRGPARYRGEEEPIDPVAGHIPGAINLPFPDNVQAGKLRHPDWLRQRFETVLANRPPETAVFYCGSGVTAAHNLLAMKHAGLGMGRLYAGSWSDWITDPSRPIATGAPNDD